MHLENPTTRPRPRRVFYGWWVVLAAGLIGGYNGGAFIYGLTLFINPVVREFGWSYLEISSAIAITGALIGFASPVVGGLVDRFGARKVLYVCATIAGLGFVFLGFVNSLFMFYVAFSIMSLGATGCGSTVLLSAIANWFRRRVGLAMGATSSGIGLGALMLPAINWLVQGYEWRIAAIVLGVGTIIVMCALATAIRQRPEDYGYLPDGDRLAPEYRAALQQTAGAPAARPAAPPASARKAIKTSTFWLLSLTITIYFTGLNSVVMHIVPFLESVHLGPATAALMATFTPVLSIAGRLGYGWLGDRLPRKYVLAMTLFSQAVGLVAFVFAPSGWAIAIFAITYGPGFGGSIALGPAMVRHYFGRTSFGSIQGWMIASTTLGGVAGPMYAGWVFDTQGSYNLAWIVFAVLNAVGIGFVLMLKNVGMVEDRAAASAGTARVH